MLDREAQKIVLANLKAAAAVIEVLLNELPDSHRNLRARELTVSLKGMLPALERMADA